ncbi:MAG TPA: ABC transporter ATP-binding protein [Clostridia bacterium]|nr:ABC transporter ATP-binding protein [Clostridia bacterium]
MTVSEKLLSIRNLKTYFFTEKGVVPAVDGVDISVSRGKVIGLVGESGCGKSITALSVLRLIESPPGRIVGGEIIFDGRNVLELTMQEMCRLRGNEISMIFQEPMTSLNPVLTIGKQVAEAIRLHQGKGAAEAKRDVLQMLDMVGIPEPERRYGSYPHQLSGGLRQRVMIAMALCCRPKLLIADEPTTALDVTIEAQILKLMKELQKQIDTAIIMITHNLGVVAELCDDVYVMYAGKIVEAAGVYELFDRPLHPYTNGLMNSIPRIDNSKEDTRLYSIKGMVPNLLYLPGGCRFSPRCEEAMDICREREPELYEVSGGHYARCFKYCK